MSGRADSRAGTDRPRTVVARAPAKVNLHLEVLKQRHDGYHEIETVLQAVQIFDTLTVNLAERRPGGRPDLQLVVQPDVRGVTDDANNLCWRAAAHFCREMGVSGRLVLGLTKVIPVGAGLGGGSSDAAAVLVACNRLFATGLDEDQLQDLGAPLGADVPFFIRGGTALGRGIGTTLTPLPLIRSGRFLIVKPGMELSTQEVYRGLKMGLTVRCAAANIQVIRPQLARFPRKTWPGYNRLEDVVLPAHPALHRLVLRLRELAPVAMMSGSGSAVVGVFPDEYDFAKISAELKGEGLQFQIVGPHAAGVEIMDD